MKKTLLIIAGPTAVGKTAVCLDLATHFKTEVISADSRQFFREMNIGTAKPDPEQLSRIPHHFINSHSVTEKVTAGSYAIACRERIELLFKKHDVLIMTGGSGLFIQAAIQGLDELPPANTEIRKELEKQLLENGIDALQSELMKLDPEYYKVCDKQNARRLIRAIEINRQSKIPYSQLLGRKTATNNNFEVVFTTLNIDREKLYERIDNRVDQMIIQGLTDEVKSLLPYRNLPALQSVGYKEIFKHLDGDYTLDEAVSLIKQNSRNYAKRQITWFKKVTDNHWFDPADQQKIIDLV